MAMFRYLVRYNKRHEGNEWWRKVVGRMKFEGSQPSGAKAHADKPVALRARTQSQDLAHVQQTLVF
jgi:hypothetical protein